MNKTKNIIILMITLFAVMLIGTTKVNAVEITDEVWKAIPNEISVNVKEIEYEKAPEMIKSQIIEILKGKGVTVSKEDIQLSIGTRGFERKTNLQINNKSKEVKIIYKNSANYDENNKQNIDKILKNFKPKRDEYFGYIEVKLTTTPELGKEYNYEDKVSEITECLTKQGYVLSENGGAGGGGDLIFTTIGSTGYEIFKNDIYYGEIRIEVTVQDKLTIPSNVEDTETAIINYAMPIIEKFLNEEEQYNGNGTIGIDNIEYKAGDGIVIKKYKENYYRVSNKRTQELIGTIILEKQKSSTTTKEDTATGIKVVGTLDNTVTLQAITVKEQTTIDKVNQALPKTIIKHSVYDINLLRDGAKVQPNGKVKVSIPIPNGYNKERLTIYRVEENGKTTKYDVKVEGNYATFETDHFSIYVLAETKATTSNPTSPTTPTTTAPTQQTTKREKDNTPKTGVADITKYIVAVAVMSAVGIIALRRKETK